jgi:hypothetical protein
MNEWSCSSVPPLCLHDVDRENLVVTNNNMAERICRGSDTSAVSCNDVDL